jgi:hypothetical protein
MQSMTTFAALSAHMRNRIIYSPLARDIPLRARVEFTQFGVTLAGRVIGISDGTWLQRSASSHFDPGCVKTSRSA